MIQLVDNPHFSFLEDSSMVSIHYFLNEYNDDLLKKLNISIPAELNNAVLKRKAEFVAGRFCALKALERYTPNSRVGFNSDRSPKWPNGFVGSITHTIDYASAVVATSERYRSLGIDSEIIFTRDTVEQISELIWTREEFKKISSFEEPKMNFEQLATFIFSAKESVFKCLYPLVGKYFEFQDVEITDITQNNFTFQLLRDLNQDFSTGYRGVGSYQVTINHIHCGISISV